MWYSNGIKESSYPDEVLAVVVPLAIDRLAF